jgi:hypothetical protein
MATFDADIERMTALELKERIVTLYADVLPIFTTVSGWELNRTDPFLPPPFDVRVQLESYRALELERLRLDEYVKLLLTAQVGDTLTYPPPPSGGGSGLADGSGIADGSLIANGEGA